MSLPCGQVSTLCVFESETLDQPMFFENIYYAKLTLLLISNRYYKLSIAVGQQPAKTKVHSSKLHESVKPSETKRQALSRVW